MTTRLDTKMRATASRIINKYGKSVHIVSQRREYDHVTGSWVALGTRSLLPVKCSPPSPASKKYVDTNAMQSTDMQVTVAALDVPIEPVNGQVWAIDSVEYRVVFVNPIHSGDQVAAYDIGLRR